MDDLLSEFLTETAESIEVVDLELVKLEQDPTNSAVLDNIFRIVHTIKGTCGFLGLPRLERIAHAAENVLGKFRDGEMVADAHAVTLVFQSFDRIKEILVALERDQAEPAGDDSDLVDRLNVLSGEGSDGQDVSEDTVPEPETPSPETDPAAPAASAQTGPSQEALDELEAVWNATPGPDDEPAEETPAGAAEDPAPAKADTGETPPAAAAADTADGEGGKTAEPSLANQNIRVSVELLEELMTMVSELVLTRNQLMQMVRRQGDSEFSVPLQRLNHCTTELQEGVMKTRMQPIGNAWSKLPRIVRDLGQDLGKKVQLHMKGEDTELDRQVLDLIRDPLTHMVRNSADHGVEGPEERVAAGKDETGHIHLNAYHEGGYILIEIRDDGRGLSIDRIKRKVLNAGLVSEAELDGMTEQQIHKFIFHPGLSTAEEVTSVSGRGVGMDVVRSNIEKIGGTVDLVSKEGKGTTFIIKIPLTLAIVSALIVECGSDRFAVPQLNVLELVRASAQSEHRIERINDTPVLRIRNRLLPLVNLKTLLGIVSEDEAETLGQTEAPDETSATGDGEDDFIVVAQVGGFTFGIVVDRVFDTEEIVVKPVSPLLRDLPYYSGNTILGDGSVVMILDPNGIASTATQTLSDTSLDLEKETTGDDWRDAVSMLVFRAGDGSQKAVPLSLVARLEELDASTIESAGGQEVVQYRGELMPLIKANDNFELKAEGRQPILVFADEEKSMGLAVDEIVDIIEDKVEVKLAQDTPGIVGTSVIAGKASEVIDVGYYLERAHDNFFGRSKAVGDGSQAGRRILVVDDSPFFRNLLKPLLTAANYDVTVVASTQEALALRDEGAVFDIIVSDIDMPEMDGFAFAEAIRAEGDWADIPLIALSGHTGEAEVEKGHYSGFNEYVAKFDKDGLLTVLADTIQTRENAA